ncbi:hypothetical protein [Saccharospirillum salsuginis]|uniref:Uncharacterized protein n=1 Tax=Saccharospirillum salsuginis TaxID=418750 RepID=A0A918NBG3_9GAMM|nr:hypothetical protein [Saccharospirillum salsuginis]GGX58227.1 hypothetical protein GCM10007392_27510 [Saccharospirillum salsuginis]
MTFKLIFKGELKEGKDQADVVESLSKLLKKSPRLIEQKLFSGKPVPIRRVGTREQARRYVAAFEKAGAVLHIAAEPEFDAESPSQTVPDSGDDPRSRLGLKVTAWVFILLLFVAGGAAWWSYPIWSFDEDTEYRNRTAAALASEDLVALASVDVKRATALEERLFGAPDSDALLSDAQGLWSTLARFGLDARRDVSDVLLGLYTSQAEPNVALVILGDFDTQSVRAWLNERFEVERVDESTRTVYFSWLNQHTCEPSPLQAMRLEPSRLVMTSAERLPDLTRRLDTNATAASALGDWRARADTSLATVAVFGPKRMGNTLPGLPGMLMAGAGEAAAPARSIILSAAPTLLPPGLSVDATLFSDNPDFLQQTYESAKTALASVRASATKEWPDLADLFDRISLDQAPGEVSGVMRFDSDFDDEIRNLVAASAGRMFGVASRPGQAVPEERIEDNPTIFEPASRSDLQAFSGFSDNDASMAWTDGPFGLAVSKLTLNEEGQLRVHIEAEGRGLPNLASRSELVSLTLHGVTDANGESLLEPGRCKPGRPLETMTLNRVSEGFGFKDGESVQYPTVTGEKTVPLAEGVTAEQVASIRGLIEYRMPTQVQRFVVQTPLLGRVVETDNVRLHFSESNASTLSYQLSGETHRLLAVRGLNEAGEVLSESSSSWGDNWFGGGKNASISIQGEANQVEVFIATELETVTFPFNLASAYPSMTSDFNTAPPTISPVEANVFERTVEASPPTVEYAFNEPEQEVTTGPGRLAIQRLDVSDFQGLYAQMQLYVPNTLPVAHQLAGAVVTFNTARLPDGRTRALNASTPVALGPDGGYWNNGEFVPDPERPWWRGDATLQLSEYEGEKPTSILGQIRFQAPLAIATEALPTQPGSRWSDGKMAVEVREWRTGEIGLHIDGQTDRLLSVQAFDAVGERVDNDVSLSNGFGEPVLWVKVADRPDRLQLLLAEQRAERSYPFELTLD